MWKNFVRWIILTCLIKTNRGDDHFIANKYAAKDYYCLTNTTFALSWTVEHITETLHQESQLLPTQQQNNFNCDIIYNDYNTKSNFIKYPWKLQNSLESHVNQVIFDRRWEGFKTFKTDYTNAWKKPLEFIKVLDNIANDFEIPISIRAKREAHILFCDGSHPASSNCYWLLLQGFQGNRSAIRKCGYPDFVPRLNDYAQNECKIERDSVEHQHFPNYLTPTKWSHLKLSKKQNVLMVTLVTYHEDKKILEFPDFPNSIAVTHMFIHGKEANALWKVHRIDYIYTNDETSNIPLGQPFYPLQNEVCIAMFVSMCDSCKLKLSLANQGVIIDENIFHSGHSRWTELKFITRSNQYKSRETNLLVSTIGQSPERFWAIDKVRLCREREFRMISLTDKASCQLMSGDNNVISFANAEPSAVEIPCPENTIGDFCVPCDTMVYGNCNRMKICTKQRCFCSAGYQGRDCSSECAKNENYGHGCQQTCGKCNKSWYQQQVCNNVDGTCSSGCNDMYTGPKCNIPPSIIFKNAPEVTDVSTTSATIAINDFAVESSLNTQQLQLHSYTVQFKKEDSTEEMWESQNPSYEFGKSNVVVIENLEADTRYFVRAVITTGDGQLNIGPHVKYSKFTTKCEDISLDGATLKSTNTSVKLILIRNVSSCKLSRYQIFLKENNRNPNLNENYVVFEGLKPFTHYTIIFQHSSSTTQEKKFQTTEGVPDKISSTIITGKSTTSVDLKWVAPLINGHFLHYVVEYELGSHLACGPQEEYSTDIKRLQTTDTSISINDLSPYSNYSFSIFAANSIFQGAPYTFIESTLSSETIGSEEIPKINITAGMFDSNVGLLFDCANLKGPIIIKTTLKCLNEWCNNQSNNRAGRRLNTTNFGPTTTLDNLIPFTDYVFEAIFCRNETNCRNEPENVSFKTEPSVPNIPTDVLIYNKNESSISLRWKPPYPPTGILQEYKIVYYYIMNRATYSTDQFGNIIASCRIWQDFHCTTLYDLKPNKRYNIAISSRNINPSNFSLPSSIVRGDTKIDKSDPPYNVSVFWTDLNDLELRWNHPNRTNGDVQYFGINVNSRSESVHRKLFVNDFNVTLNYNYTIDAEELTPTTNYKIKIWAYNAYFGDEAKVTTMSPPDIPKLSYESGVVSESNDSLTLKISLEEPQGEHERVQLLVFVEESRNDMASGERRNVINCTIRNFNEDLSIMIGKYTQQQEICISPKHTAFNLEAGTHYNITVLLENSFRGMTRRSAHFYSGRTLGEPKSVGRNMSLLGLLALVFIIAIAAAVYVKRNKLKSMKDDFFQRQTTSAEVLDKHDDQIPLSNVEPPTVVVQSQKKTIKTQKDDNPNSKTKIYSKCVKVTEFEEYVKECLMNGELQRQHSLFPRGPTKAWNYGSVKENKSKNRYNNLIAYDHSRVVLQKLSDVPHSDYINASYINGHRVPKAYIATQGPKQATLNDFWRMIWQENVSHIANLANIYEGGKKKVEKYWPDVNETLQFGNISVQHDGSKVYADYEHRMFIVSQGETSRKVDQLHFSSWPDHGVPLYSQSLVPFLRSMLHLTTNSNSPIVVHCSAGVGRTGTILLCDICLRMAAREGKIDVLRNLQLLRDQRANMVDNIEQYKLAHLVILECLVGMHTNIPCLEIEKSVEKLLANDGLDLQLRYLKETQWQDEAMKSVTQVDEDVSVVAEKNRFPNIIPDISGRIFIPHYPVDDETSSYINAVKVDGFRSIGRYIVTQQPMPNTLSDFWRLVDSCNLSVVISLNEINPKDQTCCRFWPTAGHPQMTPVPIITLKHANTVCLDHYDLITVHLFTNSRKEHLQVYIISLKKWQPGTATPDGIKDFLAFWEKSDAIARRSNPAIITCYDGVTACGLYVAMSFLIEKMKLEQICDVCQAVRTVRHNRQQFVQDVEQFEFLYRSAVAYISEFESYANFT